MSHPLLSSIWGSKWAKQIYGLWTYLPAKCRTPADPGIASKLEQTGSIRLFNIFLISLSPFLGNVHNFTSQIQIQQLIKQTEGRVPDLADWAEQSLQGA